MKEVKELTIEEMNIIDGGWNLLEYAVMGAAYITSYPLHHSAGHDTVAVYSNGGLWP